MHGAGEGERAHYRAFAECFAAAGIASLIYDRRGHGESDGPRDMDLFVLGKDAEAAFSSMGGQSGVDPTRVGIWGYSNGAWVASLAAEAVGPAFLVLAGASGVTPGRAEAYRRAEDLRSQGIGDETVTAVERAWTLIFDMLAIRTVDENRHDELHGLSGIIRSDSALDNIEVPDFVRERPELDSVPRFDRPPLSGPPEALAGTSPDMGYDPIPVLMRLSCPTLIVLAENDANTAPMDSLARFELVRSGRPGVRVEVLPGADHQFSASGGRPRTPGTVRTVADYYPGYLDLMAGWIAEVTGVVAAT